MFTKTIQTLTIQEISKKKRKFKKQTNKQKQQKIKQTNHTVITSILLAFNTDVICLIYLVKTRHGG
jgi:hypothetical protein